MTDTSTGADLSASDDFAAFEASVDGGEPPANPTPEPQPEPEPAQANEGQDDAAAGEDAPKPKKTAQQRIDELTWKANEAERRERQAQEKLEAALSGRQQRQEPAAARGQDQAPNPNEYEFGEEDAAFIRDQARFEARQEFEAERRQEQERQALAKSRETFDQRKAEAFPDGDPEGFKAYCAIQSVPTALNDIIMVSDVGPQLAAHYGDNKNDLERLSALPLHLQVYEIAKVEARLGATSPAPAETKPKPKIVTSAPSPAPQVRGSAGQFKVAPDTDDFAAFEKAYS